MATDLTVDQLLITQELYQRVQRAPDLSAELSAHRELSELMTADPQLAIDRFLDLALELCPSAGSSGLSELGVDEGGGSVFVWTGLKGEFAPYVGGTTPRDFSPCGLCLDHHHTILVDRPARVFTYFNEAEAEIVEGLIVPLYDTGKRPIGTLWVVSHEPGQQFCATDARVMEQLAVQLVLAIKLRRKAKLMNELKQVARDKDDLVEEVHHRVKNTIQLAASLLTFQAGSAETSGERAVLLEAQSRLMVLARVHEALHQTSAGGGPQEVRMAALLDTLCSSLGTTAPKGSDIRIVHQCDDLVMGTDRATPIGLIINEAVTNALKHAYPAGGSGLVEVKLVENRPYVELSISDDGVGITRPVRDGSLGMKLMKGLSRQLGGNLEIAAECGTQVAVRFKSTVRSKVRAQD